MAAFRRERQTRDGAAPRRTRLSLGILKRLRVSLGGEFIKVLGLVRLPAVAHHKHHEHEGWLGIGLAIELACHERAP